MKYYESCFVFDPNAKVNGLNAMNAFLEKLYNFNSLFVPVKQQTVKRECCLFKRETHTARIILATMDDNVDQRLSSGRIYFRQHADNPLDVLANSLHQARVPLNDRGMLRAEMTGRWSAAIESACYYFDSRIGMYKAATERNTPIEHLLVGRPSVGLWYERQAPDPSNPDKSVKIYDALGTLTKGNCQFYLTIDGPLDIILPVRKKMLAHYQDGKFDVVDAEKFAYFELTTSQVKAKD